MAVSEPSPSRSRYRRNRPLTLLVSLVLMMLVEPAFEDRPFAKLAMSVLFTLVGISSVLSVSKHRRLPIIAAFLAVPCIVLNWLNGTIGLPWAVNLLAIALLIALMLFLVIVLLTSIMTTPRVTGKTLCRAVSGYLLIGLAWAGIYQLIVLLDGNAISTLTTSDDWGDYVYFSFTALTTLGFGDITPVSPYARSLVILEATLGPMYLTILIARLVSLYGKAESNA